MIRRPTGHLRIDPTEPKLGQIEFIDKDVDQPNGIILANPVLQAFGKQRALPAIQPLNEALHPIPPQIAWESYSENHFQQRVFTQPGSPDASPRGHSDPGLIASRSLRGTAPSKDEGETLVQQPACQIPGGTSLRSDSQLVEI